jgi:hypothetical protein
VKIYNDSENTGINEEKHTHKNTVTINNERLNTGGELKSRENSDKINYRRRTFPKPKNRQTLDDIEEKKTKIQDLAKENVDMPYLDSNSQNLKNFENSHNNIQMTNENHEISHQINLDPSKEESIISDKIPSDKDRYKSRYTYTSKKSPIPHSPISNKLGFKHSSLDMEMPDYLNSELSKSLKKDNSMVDSKDNSQNGTNKVPVNFYNLVRKRHTSRNSENVSQVKEDSQVIIEGDINIHFDMEENKK